MRGAKFVYVVSQSGVPRGASESTSELEALTLAMTSGFVKSKPLTVKGAFPARSVGGGLTSQRSP